MPGNSFSMTQQLRKILEILKDIYPTGTTALQYETDFQLLVAVILSAQCTDAQVNKVTAVLFSRYPDSTSLANTQPEEIKKIIRPTGYFNSKTAHIHGTAKMIEARFNGRVPHTMEELTKLPGVARKTANVVLQVIFDTTVGVVVDTHVARLSQRMGLAKTKSPITIEKELMKLLPETDWKWISLALIQHGRQICIARKPKCKMCPLNEVCPSAFKF